MDRKALESAATRVTNLRGLLGIPGGLIFMAVGLGNLGWGPFAHEWFLVAVMLVLVMSLASINRFYDKCYGKVTLLLSGQARNLLLSVAFFGFGMIGGAVLDYSFDLSISLYAICFALAMIGWYAISVGLKTHHYVIWGALLVVGLIPIWGSLDDKTSVAWLPIGLATICCGLMDHLTLVRDFGARGEDDDA